MNLFSSHFRSASLAATLACAVCIGATGCSSLPKFGKKEDFNTKLKREQSEKIMASLEDKGVPRKRKDLKNPHALELWHAKWQEQRGNIEGARNSYIKALKSKPESVEAMIGMANLFKLEDELEQAETAYRTIVKSNPDSPLAHHALGAFYVSQKRWPEALPLLRSASEIDPKNKRFHYDLGVALAKTGQTDLAFAEMAQSVSEAEAHFNIGYLLDQDGKKAEAHQQMALALAKNPKLSPAKSWMKTTPNTQRALPGVKRGEERIFQVSAEEQKFSASQLRDQHIQHAHGQNVISNQNTAAHYQQGHSQTHSQLPQITPTGSGHSHVSRQTNSTTIQPMVPSNLPPGMTLQQWEQMKNQVSN